MGDHVWRDPALTGVGDDARFGDPAVNPIAFIPVDGDALPSARSVLRAAPAQPWDPGGTYLMPVVGSDVVFHEHTDWASRGALDYTTIDPGLTYSRFVPADMADALSETEAHVRAHLSSVADSDDDPDTRADDVRIEHRAQHGGTLIVGRLPGASASAPYLLPDYDPDQDHTGHTFERWVPEVG